MPPWTESEVSFLKEKYPATQREELVEELEREWPAIRAKAQRIGVSRHPQYKLIKSVREAPEPHFPNESFNNYIVGLVDGEGTFTRKRQEGRPTQYRFGIELVDGDIGILKEVCDYLGVGNNTRLEPREDSHQPTISYNVQNFGELTSVIVPFFREYPPRAQQKCKQFERWRMEIMQKKRAIGPYE